ncbi:aldehyde dehydrogenase family protein [Kiloniella sp. b19]|uniref:aldehyde dehydrogenase family protein n=1 Tax=Kiloniella sp. GXU_MW_B19 TaxID=3141326 RepID=UPI0031D0C5DB
MTNRVSVVNPYDLQEIGEISLVDENTVDRYLEQAHQLYRNRSNWLPAFRRIGVLKKTARLMADRFDELAFQIADEGGKPLIDARIEVTRAIDGVELCIKELSHLGGREIPMDLTAAGAGRMAFTTREPIGVVVAVSAFNHPLNLIVHQVAPAVAVGCPVLVKPATATPLSCRTFIDILHEAGLPEEWARFTPCDNTVATRMVTDPRVAFFSFIGSGKVGWMLRSKLAPGTRCALEHGGVAPVIIDEGADLKAMIPALLKGGFYHSGQVCVSVQRIYAPQDHAQEIAERLAIGAAQLKVGNAIHDSTECGPLIQPREVDRVAEWISEARDGGAKVLCGGDRLSETTYAPTVLLDAPEEARISKMEIFGPAVSVYGYEDFNEAIARANSLPFAFQAAVFTDRLERAMSAVRELDATAVMVNDHTAFRTDWMPFAGRRQSGYNTGGIGYTMHDMTQDKMAVIRL